MPRFTDDIAARGGDQRDGQMPLAPDNEWNVGPDVTTTA
jgi:hypothetical protein